MSPAVFSHGDLRLYLLALLAESPQHGYGIIQALTDRTGGTYTPSAGTIYPRLAKLEEEGLVTKTADGRTTIYAITDAGRAELAAREGDLQGIEAGLNDSVRLIANEVRQSVQEAMRSLRADLAAAAREERSGATASSYREATARADERIASREELRRADASINEFRARVRADLRTHVAKGGLLPAQVVSDLDAALDAAAHAVTSALAGLRS
ncbi:PadR family transcriptional regulator [Microbacterium azadirachtae]|uniref:PadR family transcriptional regulator n=1 Tax=Microbacterium azadirachtae TaxID=582680 RepID=UPI00088E30C4|nr:PadR family transcriptional regulator [Microbacterium azadirachtae]SDL57950.1 DNA-binding transcriptional regulator, PadR family [Microbacterium azadirachtae]SEF86836.1 DNA-binding transcriptional regulator, PadR family [Microbacterium azadirachtae]SEF88678.1 DNA-binding transcriptional regulator, PadR family [Microbacterium azadirachtae]